jgi:hypothetical protein
MLNHWNVAGAQALREWQNQGLPGRVVAHVSQETNCPYVGCGWDEHSQSGKLLGCPTCGGAGKLFTFELVPFRAVVVWGKSDLSYILHTPGIEVGDVYLRVETAVLAAVNTVLASQRSFFKVDGISVRPSSITPAIVPGLVEATLVSCKRFDADKSS